MIISWRKKPELTPIETPLALGFRIKHNNLGAGLVEEKIMWVPKSLLKNEFKPGVQMADIPDWFYDRKIDELFFGIKPTSYRS